MTATASSLPRNLTSYDLLKMVAVLLMIVDHIGAYFFPDVEEFRAIGRWCVPIWFFLIGYANSRDLGKPIWIGAGVLILADIVTGMSLLPLSILATIIIVRIFLNIMMDFASENARQFWILCAGLVLLILPTIFLFEYGTEGFLLAMVGYLIRNKEKFSDGLKDLFVLFAFVIFVVAETIVFGFDRNMVILMSAGLVVVFISLYYFQSVEFTKATQTLPNFVTRFVQFFGRHTLLIYVGHLVAFKLAATILYPERFGVFNWSFF